MDAVGILGGTFDPIHLGHLRMAEAVQAQLDLKRMLFIPDGDPPHKGELALARHRLKMVELAVADHPRFEANDLEIKRPGITYTVDTLSHYRAWHPLERVLYVVGADTLQVIETWRDFPRVARLLDALAVVPRPGISAQALAAQADFIRAKYHLVIHVIDHAVSPLSSTDVRFAAARRLPLGGMVPAVVEKYIQTHRLYRDPVLEELRRTMTPARYHHTLGVEQTALKLATRHGVDPEKARMAALLHDCAKHLPMDEMLKLILDAGMGMAAGETESRALMHAAAGCVLAKEKFGCVDLEILSAIRWHTTGKAGMSALDKVIYLADMIEPGRRSFPSLERIREAAERDLDEAMRIAARRTVDYVKSRDMPLNERTLELLRTIEEPDVKGEQ